MAACSAGSPVGRSAAPVGVVLRRPDGTSRTVGDRTPVVTVTGPPGSCCCSPSVAQDHARVDLDGEPGRRRRPPPRAAALVTVGVARVATPPHETGSLTASEDVTHLPGIRVDR